jgi:hypothetical protein
MPDRKRRNEGRDEPLEDIEDDYWDGVARPEGPPDVRRADVPAADGPDVDALRPADDPVPEGETAGQVADEDEGERLDQCPFQ